ncbi:MAG: DUF6036 family nucleotidyltransferase [Elusimicrobia bacterium]|nr:DUF6036 family nucleotidyltransferase [Elusimicrobiota bacterium]
MKLIHKFLAEIDARWKPAGGGPIRLKIIGSAALMLQADYERGTKDGDVLEADEITPAVREQLLALAGPKAALFQKYRMYVEIVTRAIMFLPQKPVFRPVPGLALSNFSVEVLDLTDVVVSKLKRLNQNDISDIEAMAQMRLLHHARLVERFEAAVDFHSTSAYAEDFPKCIANLNRIERDYLRVPESAIELPDWMQ